jgi:hypothetical protein
MTPDEVRLAKDQERIRLAYEIIESLESMIFYRGRDSSNPRIQILRQLTDMASRVKVEMERDDEE